MSEPNGVRPSSGELDRERWRGRIDAEIHSHDRELKQLKSTLATKEQVEAIKELVQTSLDNSYTKVEEMISSITVRCSERGLSCSQKNLDLINKTAENARISADADSALSHKIEDIILPKLQNGEIKTAVQSASFGFWVKVTMLLLAASVSGSGLFMVMMKLTGKI